MTKKIWKFELEDGAHIVELEHGYWSGKRRLIVDGKVIEEKVNLRDMFADLGSEHAFEINGSRCFIHVIPPGFNMDYDLVVDGSSLRVGEQIRRLEPQRSCFLSAYLILMMAGNLISGLVYLLAGGQLQRAQPDLPMWAIISLGLVALGNAAFADALWNWRKWGFYGFCVSVGVIFLLNLASGLPWYVAVIGLAFGILGVAILVYLLQTVWRWMR